MRSVLLLITALLLSATPAQAEKIYRWTDADGQVHFGSQPPRELQNKAEAIEVRTPRLSTPAAAPDTEATPAATTTTEVSLAPGISAEQAAAYCQQARQQKETLAVNFNRRFQMPDGTFRPLTDAERAEQNKTADEIIRQHCR